MHHRHNMQPIRILTANPNQIENTHSCNSHSALFTIATSSTSTPQVHMFSHPRYLAQISRPTWLVCAHGTPSIGTSRTIKTQCGCRVLVWLASYENIQFQSNKNVKLALKMVTSATDRTEKRRASLQISTPPSTYLHIHYVPVKTFILYIFHLHNSPILCVVSHLC